MHKKYKFLSKLLIAFMLISLLPVSQISADEVNNAQTEAVTDSVYGGTSKALESTQLQTVNASGNFTSSAIVSKASQLSDLISVAQQVYEDNKTKATKGIDPKDPEYGTYSAVNITIFYNQIMTAQFYLNSVGATDDTLVSAFDALVNAGVTFLNSVKDSGQNASNYTSYRRDLTVYVFQAKAKLIKDSNCYPDQAKLVLQDAITEAENSLNGISPYPCKWVMDYGCYDRVDDAIQYSTSRTDYSMYDWAQKKGLKNIITFYDLTKVVSTQYDAIISRAQTSLDTYSKKVGTNMGEYPGDKVDALSQAIQTAKEVKNSSSVKDDQIVSALVNVINAETSCTQSVLSNTPVAKGTGYLNFTKDELDQLRIKIKQDPVLLAQYNTYKAIAQQNTLEQVKNPAENMKAFYGQTNVDVTSFGFTVPNNQEIEYCRIRIVLPKQPWDDGEEAGSTGQNKVENDKKYTRYWIDDIGISDPSGSNILLKNPGMEKGSNGNTSPLLWKPIVLSGNPILKWDNTYQNVNSGSRSLELCNPTKNDSGAWEMEEFVPVKPGTYYNLGFAYKLYHNRLQNPARVEVRYYNTDSVDETSDATHLKNYDQTLNARNAISNPVCQTLVYDAQMDAIAYMVDQEPVYAQKVKYEIMYALADMAEGSMYRYIWNWRADGKDNYGAVQAGRVMNNLCIAYDLIRYSGVFSPEEDTKIKKLFNFVADYLYDAKDLTRGYYDIGMVTGGSNWVTDQCAGGVMFGLIFPDYKNGQIFFNAQLAFNTRFNTFFAPDGSFPAVPRYAGQTPQNTLQAARAIKHSIGIDYFGGMFKPGIPEYLKSIILLQAPPNKYQNNRVNYVAYGDTNWGEGNIAPLGQYLSEIKNVAPDIADQAYITWRKGGSPLDTSGGEYPALPALLSNTTGYVPNYKNVTLSSYKSDWYKNVFFRNNFGLSDESLFFMIDGDNEYIEHGQSDYGSFQLWADCELLVGDPGTSGYWDSDVGWYKSSVNHSCLTFNGGNTSPIYGSNKFDTSQMVDYAMLRANAPGGYHNRNVAYVKDGFNIYLVWDQLHGVTAPSLFTLPLFVKSASENGNKVLGIGHYTNDIEVTSLEPQLSDPNAIKLESKRIPNVLPGDSTGACIISMYRKTSPAGASPLAIIKPVHKGETGVQSTKLDVGNNNIYAYKITNNDGKWFIAVMNNSTEAADVKVPSNENLKEMRSGSNYTSSGTEVSMNIAGESLLLLKPVSLVDPAANTCDISGDNNIFVPTAGGTTTKQYQVSVKDQYGIVIPNTQVRWSIDGNTAGTSVDQDGYLKIDSSVKAGTDLMLKATSGSASGTIKITAKTELPVLSSVDIIGPSRIGVEPDKAYNINYSAVSKDQFGGTMDEQVLWSLQEQKNGVSINYATGELSIEEGALKAGDSVTIMASSAKSVNAKAAKTVWIEDPKPSYVNIGGASVLGVPKDSAVYKYTADVTNQQGAAILGSNVTWSLSGAPEDNSIILNSSTGDVKVTKDVPAGTVFNVIASYTEDPVVTQSMQVTIADRIPASVTIAGVSEINVPSGGVQTEAYNATVLDQNGTAMTGQQVKWSLSNTAPGVTINGETGELVVRSGTSQTSITVVATLVSNPSIFAQKTVNLIAAPKKNGSTTGGSSSNKGSGGSTSYTADNSINSQPAVVPVTIFDDINDVSWAKLSIEELAKAGVINGKAPKLFAPDDNVTRAEFITMMVKALGLTDDTAEADFKDVAPGVWYSQPIAVAQKYGIVQGYEDGTFGVDRQITREEMAAMAYRAVQKSQIKLLQQNTSAPVVFKDQQNIEGYALESISEMQQAGVINGMEDGSFKPEENATRAQAAKIIYGLYLLK